MKFWTLAFNMKWVTAEALKGAVITDSNPYGEITPEQYEIITGIEFVE
ncbi:XkdX family protein [Clostridium sp.]